MTSVVHVVGARPNFMKAAPLIRALGLYPALRQTLVHTGQHYDERMSKVFFDELELPRPDVDLGIGSASHGEQTGRIMIELEKVFVQATPSCVVVYGDVNSTVAAALVATKLEIPCVHVEAGLRSFDRSMPEEINRVVTDSVADLLLTPSSDGDKNLMAEGIHQSRIKRVGNLMIDSLLHHLPQARGRTTLENLELTSAQYILVTMHRPSNVDSKNILGSIVDALCNSQPSLSVVWPLHPRTRKRLDEFGLLARLENQENVKVIEPQGYLDFLNLTSNAKLVITDSGGLQEETTALGVPCLTLRHSTERPITLTEGTNTLIGHDFSMMRKKLESIVNGFHENGSVPDLWDGKAAIRAAKEIVGFIQAKRRYE